ncbi:MAG: rhomboid family intramembrane serine protease [Eubacteriales bacterium]|nr:rhomboid family intramembrane serine protease [Eubacteriales bacterium]
MTLLGMVSGGKITQMLFMTYRSPLLSPLTYVRLLTHVLGHNGWGHYAGNMSYILLLGPMLEEKYGSRTMLELIAVTAVITGLLNAALFPGTALCGASGVVFAFILMTSFTGFRQGEIPLTFLLIAVIYLGQQVADGLFLRDNISNLSHIAGGLVGAAAGYVFNKK